MIASWGTFFRWLKSQLSLVGQTIKVIGGSRCFYANIFSKSGNGATVAVQGDAILRWLRSVCQFLLLLVLQWMAKFAQRCGCRDSSFLLPIRLNYMKGTTCRTYDFGYRRVLVDIEDDRGVTALSWDVVAREIVVFCFVRVVVTVSLVLIFFALQYSKIVYRKTQVIPPNRSPPRKNLSPPPYSIGDFPAQANSRSSFPRFQCFNSNTLH